MLAEISVAVTVALITTLGSVVTALFGWLAKKGADYVDTKTRLLDAEHDLFKKEAVKDRIVDTVATVARATTQTYVDEVKDRNKDGRLSKEEAAEGRHPRHDACGARNQGRLAPRVPSGDGDREEIDRVERDLDPRPLIDRADHQNQRPDSCQEQAALNARQLAKEKRFGTGFHLWVP